MGQGDVLKLLEKKGILTTKEMADLLDKSISPVCRSVKLLREQNLIELVWVKEPQKLASFHYRLVATSE